MSDVENFQKLKENYNKLKMVKEDYEQEIEELQLECKSIEARVWKDIIKLLKEKADNRELPNFCADIFEREAKSRGIKL